MNLKSIIRKNFLPPRNENDIYDDIVSHYGIDENSKPGMYTPELFLKGMTSRTYRPEQSRNYASFYSHGRNVDYFNTIEEARNVAWQNYDSCYKQGIKQISEKAMS